MVICSSPAQGGRGWDVQGAVRELVGEGLEVEASFVLSLKIGEEKSGHWLLSLPTE